MSVVEARPEFVVGFGARLWSRRPDISSHPSDRDRARRGCSIFRSSSSALLLSCRHATRSSSTASRIGGVEMTGSNRCIIPRNAADRKPKAHRSRNPSDRDSKKSSHPHSHRIFIQQEYPHRSHEDEQHAPSRQCVLELDLRGNGYACEHHVHAHDKGVPVMFASCCCCCCCCGSQESKRHLGK